MFDWWWAYLLVGLFVGFFSGLLGIGGGSAMVPVLAFIFAAKQFSPDLIVHTALGTSTATILFTSSSSLRSHHKRNAVQWKVLRAMAPGVLVGTFAGALLAKWLDARLLSIAFTAFIFYVAVLMVRPLDLTRHVPMPGTVVMSSAGGAIGLISSLTATGGSALTVPFLARRGITIHHAIGTAAAVGWPLALAGTLGYIIGGLGVPGLPQYSVGFVYLPALAGIVLSSVLAAPLGAALAHRTPGATLKRGFALVLFVLAASMLLKFI